MKIKAVSMINLILHKFNLEMLRLFPRSFQKYGLKGKEDLVGVEIGVYKGENAECLLKRSSIKKLYLVDPYVHYEGYDESYFYETDYSKIERIAKRRLRKYSNKIIWIKKKSSNAVENIPNNIDFVYIDGNHKYEYVKEDIENYYPKLKNGGILGGHDFESGIILNGKEQRHGVIKAVTEFCLNNNLKLNVFRGDWWIIK